MIERYVEMLSKNENNLNMGRVMVLKEMQELSGINIAPQLVELLLKVMEENH